MTVEDLKLKIDQTKEQGCGKLYFTCRLPKRFDGNNPRIRTPFGMCLVCYVLGDDTQCVIEVSMKQAEKTYKRAIGAIG